jgi:hypothetical protein
MNITSKWYVFHTKTNKESTTVTLISHLSVWMKDLLAGKVKVLRVNVPSNFDISQMKPGMEISDCPNEGISLTPETYKELIEHTSLDLYLKNSITNPQIIVYGINKYA